MTDRWTPSSWRAKPAKHLPTDYPDMAALDVGTVYGAAEALLAKSRS